MYRLPSDRSKPSRHRGSTDRVLPVAGRPGPPPKWPSGHKPTPAERSTWRRLWALPQAVAWESMPGVGEAVERYARLSVAVAQDLDHGTVKAAVLAQIRGLESDLGLNPVALARLRWRIGDDDETPPQVTVTRMRPRAIDPGLVDRQD